jgi:phosphate ABC transporter permease subunit PstA
MTARTHPFHRRAHAAAYQETFVFWSLRAFTYIILGFGAIIFGIIIYKGAPAVFESFRLNGSFPYLHNDFLFTKPQTLHVFKYKGKLMQMSAADYYAFTGDAENTPEAAPAPETAAAPAVAPVPAPAPTNATSTAAPAAVVPPAPAGTAAVSTNTAPPITPTPAPAPNPATALVAPAGPTPPSTTPSPAAVAATPKVDPNDITDHETYSYAAGGIFPQIVGTVLLVIGSMTIALILGIFAAIYLSEYSRQGPLISAIRLAIINLAGVPSIVFGLFGVGMFVHFFGWNVSLLAGCFTLAFMVLPVIITASEESLRAVPKGFREGSLALGATKWQTIRQNVLPYAMPGILTSSVLGIARVAGETAPILFTAAYALSDKLPWELNLSGDHLSSGFLGYLEYPFAWVRDFLLHPVNALPYHIYVVSTKIPQNEFTERVQYGTAFVFLAIVMTIALTSVILRIRLRSRLKW